MTCRCRWNTLWQASGPSLTVTRNPLSPSPSCLATVAATASKWPNKGSWAGVALDNCVSPDRCLGMTRKWTGAWGLTSRKASAVSSSYRMAAGICLAMILSKMVGAPPSAAAAVLGGGGGGAGEGRGGEGRGE